jgi:hypothetical protein
MNTARMPKEMVTARMEETSKRGRAWKKRIYKVEEDLKVMGIRMWQAMTREQNEWRRSVLEAKVRNGL